MERNRGGYALPCPFAMSRQFFELDVKGQPHPFFLLAAVCATRGHVPLRTRVPVGECWHERIDERWEAFINPHGVPGRCLIERAGVEAEWVHVQAQTAVITFRGWIWATVNPRFGFYLDPPAPPEVLAKEIPPVLVDEEGDEIDAVQAFALACFDVLLPIPAEVQIPTYGGGGR